MRDGKSEWRIRCRSLHVWQVWQVWAYQGSRLSPASATPRKPRKHAKSRNKSDFDRALDQMVISEAPLTAEIRSPRPAGTKLSDLLFCRTLCPAARHSTSNPPHLIDSGQLELSPVVNIRPWPQGIDTATFLAGGTPPILGYPRPQIKSTLAGGHKPAQLLFGRPPRRL